MHVEQNPFREHSDVAQAWPELFTDVDPKVTKLVRQCMAHDILDGYVPTRDEVVTSIMRVETLLEGIRSKRAMEHSRILI